MKYKIEILPTAWEDLKRIEDYYLLNFNAETALNVTDNILRGIEILQSHPDYGSITPDDWMNEYGYKMVICKKHVSIYKKIDNKIFVYHIADTRSDYTKLFKIL